MKMWTLIKPIKLRIAAVFCILLLLLGLLSYFAMPSFVVYMVKKVRRWSTFDPSQNSLDDLSYLPRISYYVMIPPNKSPTPYAIIMRGPQFVCFPRPTVINYPQSSHCLTFMYSFAMLIPFFFVTRGQPIEKLSHGCTSFVRIVRNLHFQLARPRYIESQTTIRVMQCCMWHENWP